MSSSAYAACNFAVVRLIRAVYDLSRQQNATWQRMLHYGHHFWQMQSCTLRCTHTVVVDLALSLLWWSKLLPKDLLSSGNIFSCCFEWILHSAKHVSAGCIYNNCCSISKQRVQNASGITRRMAAEPFASKGPRCFTQLVDVTASLYRG